MDLRDLKHASWLAAAALTSGALLSLLAPPVPRVHDEFSYLLAADTFASGRLTNPTHPLWQHFETIHVVHEPSYASKYPPGQGFVLALGQVLTGWPVAGVWIASALGVVASYYLLCAYAPRRWAYGGAALLLLLPGYQIVWGQSYWGGTLAYAGGALVLGGARRATVRVSIGHSLAMATGAIILSVTRPFEGAVFCLIVGAWIAAAWIRDAIEQPHRERWYGRVLKGVVPVVTLGFAGLALLGAYNAAVTGSALKMPYQVHEEAYGVCPLFLWQVPHVAPVYLHQAIADFHNGWSMEWFDRQQSWSGLVSTKWEMVRLARKVYLPWFLALPLVGVWWWRGKTLRAPLLVLAATWLMTQLTVWNWPHYIAPAAPVLLLAVVWGLRNANVWGRHRSLPLRPATALVACQAVLMAASAYTHVTQERTGWQHERQAIAAQLAYYCGEDVVIVKYDEGHLPLEEWVYNRADIDAAPVVWARDMGDNRALMDYFPCRTIWKLEADATPPTLTVVRSLVGGEAISPNP